MPTRALDRWQALARSEAGARLRALCLALPEAAEVPLRRGPTYRVDGRIFAMERADSGGAALWCKAPRGSQELLRAADPAHFFAPPYVGVKGWIGMRLDAAAEWDEVAALVRRSYALIAPKRLAALVG